MQTPDTSRQPAQMSWTGGIKSKPNPMSPEWRCKRCDKLLGVCRDGRMHLRFARCHEYLVGYPVQSTCRGCGTLNQAQSPAR